MFILVWILSVLVGLIGCSYLISLPLGFLSFYGLYSAESFDISKMEYSVIGFFPLSCLFFIFIGKLIGA